MKNIIVTGSSRGIGMELCKMLAEKENKVLAISRNISDSLNEIDNVTQLSIDITKTEDIKKLKEYIETHFDKIDILINNAGAIINKPFKDLTIDDFRYIYEVNVFGVAELIKTCLPKMQAGSHVINISSVGGVQGSVKFPGLAAYSSSKGAIITLTELLAEEYRERKISFNVLALGAVQTDMLEEAFPGYIAPLNAKQMAEHIADFSLKGNLYFNGKIIQVSSTTP